MQTLIRNYQSQKDIDDVKRIWLEIGWIDKSKEHKKALELFLSDGKAIVAEINSSAECMVSSNPATLRYDKSDMDLAIITSVTTSRIARKRGLAKKMTVKMIAENAEACKGICFGYF